MDAQDVADLQDFSRDLRCCDHLLGGGERVGERLLTKHMGAGAESLHGHAGVMFRIDRDRDGVGLQLCQRDLEIVEARHALEFRLEILAPRRTARAKADEIETRNGPVRPRVTDPHCAETNNQHFYRRHFEPHGRRFP